MGWGPNNTFKFPRSGGTGEIYRRVADRLGSRVRFGRELDELDAERRELRFADGTVEGYDALVTTMPLDLLVGSHRRLPRRRCARRPRELRHNSVAVVGVGYERPLENDTSWMYFPGRRHALLPRRRTSPSTRPRTSPAATRSATART